jgi:class 3 adenylate cyclase/pimeloyl-ACP methyl ester carboxylesterase
MRGVGEVDLVRLPGMMGGLLGGFLDPVAGAHYDHLASFTRLIRLDRRGTGLSDPLVAGGAPQLEQQVEDIVAVMDHVGSERAALYGAADGGPVAILFAAMYPDRVAALVLSGAWARFYTDDDYPWGRPNAERDWAKQQIEAHWGDVDDPWLLDRVCPSRQHEPGFAGLLARLQQVTASKAEAPSAASLSDGDVRAVLPLVQAATLVVCAADAPLLLSQSKYLVDRIPNARLATFPGADNYFGVETPRLGAIIEEFLTGARPVVVSDRVLATVLFTDIVGSTERAADVGDQHWKELLNEHDRIVREELTRAGGVEVKQTGDGFLASFDGPARAIGCAQVILRRAAESGIDVRAGVHVGECEKRGNDLAGIAVHIGARVSALAGPGEVYATSTVRDLVAGSLIQFTDRGRHELKGVPGEWTILAAT